MKYTLLAGLWLWVASLPLFAQDLILKRDGTFLSATVLEVQANQISYKRFDQLNGPTYSIPKAEIASIRYADGTTDSFESVPVATATAVPVRSMPPVPKPTTGSVSDQQPDLPYWKEPRSYGLYMGGTLAYAGGMLGYAGKSGGIYWTLRYGSLEYYSYGNITEDKFTSTVGGLLRVAGPVYLYAGLGAGYYDIYGTDVGFSNEIFGLEVESGLMVDVFDVFLLLGFSSTGFWSGTEELTFGIGTSF